MPAKKNAKKTKRYTVELRRTTIEGVSIDVEATDEEEAKDLAFKAMEEGSDEYDWDLLEDETEVTDVYIEK